MEQLVEFAEPDLLLALREIHEPLDVALKDLRDAQELRPPRIQHDRTRRERLLAVRERIERSDRLVGVFPGGQLQLDAHGVAREVVHLADADLLLPDRLLDRRGERVRRLAPGEFGDDEALAFLLDLRADLHLAEAVLVVGDVHDAAELEIGIE